MAFEIFSVETDLPGLELMKIIQALRKVEGKGFAARWETIPSVAKETRKRLNVQHVVSLQSDPRGNGTIVRLKPSKIVTIDTDGQCDYCKKAMTCAGTSRITFKTFRACNDHIIKAQEDLDKEDKI